MTQTGEDTDADSTASWERIAAATDTEGRFRIVRFHDRVLPWAKSTSPATSNCTGSWR